MIKKIPILIFLHFFAGQLMAQDSLQVVEGYIIQGNTKPKNKNRLWITAGANAALWGGSFVLLNKAWYADYAKTSFHFFNDNGEWNQMDKLGHIWTSYHVSRGSAEIWNWAGLSKRESAIIGSISGVAYLSIIEVLDGYSNKWGFSWGDIGANVIGAAGFGIQQLAWKDQRLSIRLSYWPYNYAPEFRQRRNELFGSGFSERILKDYNAQTYWLSANLRSFAPGSNIPKWLNVAFGYGAKGMLGGRENVWTDNAGVTFDRRYIQRTRHFYFAPDIDFTKIKTRSKLVNNLLFMLNVVKFPAPGIELDSKGNLNLRLIAY